MLFLWIIGCNAIDESEARLTFTALGEPLTDLRDEAIESEDEQINISLTLGNNWEGTATASGTMIEDGLQDIYPLTVTLTDVYVPTEDVTISGTISFGVEYFLDPTDVSSYEKKSSVDGEVTISGDAKGIADLAYQFQEVYDADGSSSFSASGTISGFEVSQFTTGEQP